MVTSMIMVIYCYFSKKRRRDKRINYILLFFMLMFFGTAADFILGYFGLKKVLGNYVMLAFHICIISVAITLFYLFCGKKNNPSNQ